jgi:hypothetical protein
MFIVGRILFNDPQAGYDLERQRRQHHEFSSYGIKGFNQSLGTPVSIHGLG